jgi:hypothetical protein
MDPTAALVPVVSSVGRLASTSVGRVADVVALPVRRQAVRARVAIGARHDVDDWGRDPALVGVVHAVSRLRWDVTVGGHLQLPRRSGALVVVNARRYALAPVFTALSLGAVLGRPVRFVGRPDVAPIGPLAQRLGGLLTRDDELANVLRSGDIVVMGAEPTMHPRRVGHVDHCLVGAAVAAGVRVFPATASSATLRRSARVEITAPLAADRKRRGPLAELELADRVEQRIQQQLDELGGALTGTPLDWLPLSGMGGS